MVEIRAYPNNKKLKKHSEIIYECIKNNTEFQKERNKYFF